MAKVRAVPIKGDELTTMIRPFGQRKSEPLVKCRRAIQTTVAATDYIRNAKGNWILASDYVGQATALFECVLRPCK